MDTQVLTIDQFLRPHLRANIHMFVPHAEATVASIKSHLDVVLDSPIWAAVNGDQVPGGVMTRLWGRQLPVPPLDLKRGEYFPCTLEIAKKELDPSEGGNFCRIALGLDDQDARCRESLKAIRKNCPVEGVRIPGAAIRLPRHLSRLQAAWEAKVAGMPYTVNTLCDRYLDDLGEAAALIVDRTVMEHRLPGLQAQADSDVRLRRYPERGLHTPMAEVGLAEADADRLLALFEQENPYHPVQACGIAGLHLLLLRYPASGPKSACWVQLQILKDRRPGKIYVEPVTWTKLQGGDTDGDLGYLLLTGHRFGRPRPMGAFPRLVMNPSLVKKG